MKALYHGVIILIPYTCILDIPLLIQVARTNIVRRGRYDSDLFCSVPYFGSQREQYVFRRWTGFTRAKVGQVSSNYVQA